MFGVMRAPRARKVVCAHAPNQLNQLTSRTQVIFKIQLFVAFIGEFQRSWPVLLLQPVLFRTNNLQVGASSPSTGSFQNQQPPKKTRKRGIAALLDRTNETCEESQTQRPCKQTSQAIVSTLLTPTFEVRGDPVKGGKAHAEVVQQQLYCQGDNTLYSLFTKTRYCLTKVWNL